jgi:hypothetical protein
MCRFQHFLLQLVARRREAAAVRRFQHILLQWVVAAVRRFQQIRRL